MGSSSRKSLGEVSLYFRTELSGTFFLFFQVYFLKNDGNVPVGKKLCRAKSTLFFRRFFFIFYSSVEVFAEIFFRTMKKNMKMLVEK